MEGWCGEKDGGLERVGLGKSSLFMEGGGLERVGLWKE